MLAFALIFALTAQSALGKPSNYCIYPCDGQSSYNGAYTQPGYGGSGYPTQPGYGSSGAYSQPGYGQQGGQFGQMGGQIGQSPSFRNLFSGMSGNLEDFGTVPVQQQPNYQRGYQSPMYSQPQHAEVHQQQIPVQPQIDGLFTHSSSKASYESNNGFLKIHQPGVSRTVISEPIRQQPMRMQPTGVMCQSLFDPCQ